MGTEKIVERGKNRDRVGVKIWLQRGGGETSWNREGLVLL